MSVTFYTNSAEEIDVNMSNVNAREVMNVLGLETLDLVGEEAGARFRERVLIAMATYNETGAIPARVEIGANGAVIHHGGRQEGYIAEKLVRLLALAEVAEKNDTEVRWD